MNNNDDFEYFDKFLKDTFGEDPIDPDNFDSRQIKQNKRIRERMTRINSPASQINITKENGQTKVANGQTEVANGQTEVASQSSTQSSTQILDTIAANHQGFTIKILDPTIQTIASTKLRKKMLLNLLKTGNQITNYSRISIENNGKISTIRKAIEHFVKLRIIKKTPYREGLIQGIKIEVLLSKKEVDKYLNLLVAPEVAPEVAHPLLEREIEDLSIKKKLLGWKNVEIKQWYPNLYNAGIKQTNIHQLVSELEKRDKSLELIIQSFEYAEWELSQGGIKDKQGIEVKSVAGYIFKSIVNSGAYRCPPGYKDQEEIELDKALEREKGLQEKREELSAIKYENWLSELSKSELEQLEEKRKQDKFPMPKGLFLKNIFRKHNSETEEN